MRLITPSGTVKLSTPIDELGRPPSVWKVTFYGIMYIQVYLQNYTRAIVTARFSAQCTAASCKSAFSL